MWIKPCWKSKFTTDNAKYIMHSVVCIVGCWRLFQTALCTMQSTLFINPHPLNHGFSGRGTPICNLHFLGGWGGRKCNLQPPKVSKIPGCGTTLDDIGRRANRSNMLSANGRSGNIQLERGTFDWCSQIEHRCSWIGQWPIREHSRWRNNKI
jgi:hypothetical protein